jgi:hypothetical protein
LKRLWKAGRIVLLSLLLLYFAVLLVYYGRVLLNQKSVEKKVGAFLKAVQERHVQEAVERYGGAIDMESMRVLLEAEGSRLLSYGRVKAEFDDGCVCGGHVDLTFEVNGKPLNVSAIFTLGPGNKPRQICALTPSGTERGSIPALSGWNRTICGGDSF